MDDVTKLEIRHNVYEYLKELCKQLKTRFNNFDNNYYDLLEIFDPENAMNVQYHQNHPQAVVHLVDRFSIFLININNPVELLNNEFARLLFYDNLPDNLMELEIEDFWFRIYDISDDNNIHLFRNLSTFALRTLIIAPSNVEPERWFSAQNQTHSKWRNKLHVETVDGILLSKQCVQLSEDCRKYQPDEEAIASYLQIYRPNNL